VPISITQPSVAHDPMTRAARADAIDDAAQQMAAPSPPTIASMVAKCAGTPRGGCARTHLIPSAFGPAPTRRAATSTIRSERFDPLAKTPRTWTGARTPSGLKRVRQAERRHDILQPRRSAAKTYVATALSVATADSDAETAARALAEAHAALDRAAKVGAIHPNAAARRKSRLTLKFNAATGGAAVQTSGRVVKTTSKAQAAKAAKSRIALGKANKAKGAQTAAGKARAAVSKTARTEAAGAPLAETATAARTAPKAAAKTPAKATVAKKAPVKTTTAKKTPARKATAKG
jgi:ribosomal protein S20